MSDNLTAILDVPLRFYKDSIHFLARCTRPDRKELIKVCQAVAVGLAIMGFIGYTIKLVHIPINNIIMGGA